MCTAAKPSPQIANLIDSTLNKWSNVMSTSYRTTHCVAASDTVATAGADYEGTLDRFTVKDRLASNDIYQSKLPKSKTSGIFQVKLKDMQRAGEMAQQVRALVVEDPGLIPNICMVPYSHP